MLRRFKTNMDYFEGMRNEILSDFQSKLRRAWRAYKRRRLV